MGGGFLASLFGSGDKRPRCPPSGGNPSNLAGKRVNTPKRTCCICLRCPRSTACYDPPRANSSSPTSPRLSAHPPRAATLRRSTARSGALGHREIQGVLDACFFRTRAVAAAGDGDGAAEVPAPSRAHIPSRGTASSRAVQRSSAVGGRCRGDSSPLVGTGYRAT